MSTIEKIIEFLKENGQSRSVDLVDYLGISRQALYKHLPKLLDSGMIIKIGKPPQVFYLFNGGQGKIGQSSIYQLSYSKIAKKINERFLVITPAGQKLEGMEAFVYWCNKNKLPIEKTAIEFAKTWAKYDVYYKNGYIDGLAKMKSTFKQVYLDKIFYLDFYSIERFGKTKLGQLLLYAKQSQQTSLMTELIDTITPAIERLITSKNITSVGFIPPTVKRQIQFMSVLKGRLHLKLRTISIKKIVSDVAVPQKSLTRLTDRIENAQHSIVVSETSHHGNILLIDDPVGSGATLNETAKQIREKGICDGKIIGLAITGSFKGFDVISEV